MLVQFYRKLSFLHVFNMRFFPMIVRPSVSLMSYQQPGADVMGTCTIIINQLNKGDVHNHVFINAEQE